MRTDHSKFCPVGSHRTEVSISANFANMNADGIMHQEQRVPRRRNANDPGYGASVHLAMAAKPQHRVRAKGQA